MTTRTLRRRAFAGVAHVAALLALAAMPVAAQRVQTAVLPESITVGDVFRAAVRIELEPDAMVVAPDSIALPDDVEQAGRRELRTDTVAGVRRVTVAYPLTAWRPGGYDLPAIELQLVRGDGSAPLVARLPAFEVRSVLPADTAGIQPQPARDVLGASRLWWPLLLGLLAALVVAALLYVLFRRRRPQADAMAEPVPNVPPREAALARLDALGRSGMLERGDLKPFYEALTETLRRYAAGVEPAWGVDLTTAELSQRMRGSDAIGIGDALELTRILGAADLVKFAQASVPAETATLDLAAARAWVVRVPRQADDVPAEDRRVA